MWRPNITLLIITIVPTPSKHKGGVSPEPQQKINKEIMKIRNKDFPNYMINTLMVIKPEHLLTQSIF